jgi:hypothetical protein
MCVCVCVSGEGGFLPHWDICKGEAFQILSHQHIYTFALVRGLMVTFEGSGNLRTKRRSWGEMWEGTRRISAPTRSAHTPLSSGMV